MLGRNSTRALIGVIVVALIVYYAQGLLSGRKSDFNDVTVGRAKELIAAKPRLVILDVRTPSEYSDEHIEKAINIPVDDIEVRLGELDKENELLVYCRTGNRSTRAVGILRDNGFSKIYHMTDGITSWKTAGCATVR
jgi:rhodanese-related sulfurtransferase